MTKVPAVILAGGSAVRMGGLDKTLVHHQGRPLLSHILEALGNDVGPIAINANGDPSRFADFDLPVLPDVIDGQLGPLAGLLTAMRWADAPHVLVVAGDTIGLPTGLPDLLTPAPAYIQAAGRDHPTIGLWPTALADDLHDYLMAGHRRMMQWIAKVEARPVAVAAPIRNINRPEDLR